MEDRLFEYMNRRIGGNYTPSRPLAESGPVITISRQTGCGAKGIAFAICDELNNRRPNGKYEGNWRFINSEILKEAAEELNLDPVALKNVIDDNSRNIMNEIVEALSTHSHKSDQKILKTVHDVIRHFALNGKVIIIGRGGASICSDIKKALHIKLVAPIDWRVSEIMRRMDLSKADATDYIEKSDEERTLMNVKILGKDFHKPVYDVEIERSRFTEKELADVIMQIAIIKGLI